MLEQILHVAYCTLHVIRNHGRRATSRAGGGTCLIGIDVRNVKTDPNGKVADVQIDGASVAPPEYKDAGVKFSEFLAKPRPKKK